MALGFFVVFRSGGEPRVSDATPRRGSLAGSAYFCAAISVICGVMIFFLCKNFAPRESVLPGDGYAVLSVDDSEDDRFIREILERSGIENVISESSQSVHIHDFTSMRIVQLDIFHTEIAYFDPRDTGYAAKLKDFFVHDGSRFFFIPLDGNAGNRTANLKRTLDTVLYGIPFSLAFRGHERPFFLYFALIALGSAFTLCFSQSRRQFSFQLPVLLAMGWGAFSAAILAALLCGIWELLREPLKELSAARRYQRSSVDYAGAGFMGLVERLKPFRANLFRVVLFLFLILVFSVTGDLPPVPTVAICVSFFFLNFMSFQVEKERMKKNLHIPFTPVLLFPVRSRTFSLFPFLLPFAAVSLLVITLPRIVPGISPPDENTVLIDPRYLVSAEDFYRHMAFQHSFPYRSLNHRIETVTDGELRPFYQDAYLRYYLGDDGLIAGSFNSAGSLVEGPPFPLEKLMGFLINYDNQTATGAAGNSINIVEWILVLIIFTVCIADMFRPRILPKKRIPVFRDKRIAA
jgi:hypothetical protein